MKFDIERKGYKKTEVDEYIFSLKNDYESKLTEQKNRIFQLRNELDEKEKKIAEYSAKAELISSALIHAVAKADEIEKLAQKRYREEISALRAFHEKWQAHYDALLKKYPDDEGLRAQSKFNSAMDEVLSGGSEQLKEIESHFVSEQQRVEKVVSQAPKKTLAEDAVSESGFSFAEAWNPTDDLSKIMEDLGILPDEE